MFCSQKWLVLICWGMSYYCASAAEPVENPYRPRIQAKLQAADESKSIVVKGSDDWLFFTPELRTLTVGPFWGEHAKSVSRTTNPQFADPLGPIIDFREQLKLAGIELLVVPVPAKAAIYPEALIPGLKVDANAPRIDAVHAQFYKLLQERGVNVLDLRDEFLRQKEDRGPLYCRTDSHWSGRGAQVAAETIAARVKLQPWFAKLTVVGKLKRDAIRTEPLKVTITGDLALLFNEKQPTRETLELSSVTTQIGGKTQPIPTDETSPILVLGDSHTLVFHDPMLFAESSGLVDHLAQQLETRLDLIGVRGSGANAARITWRRRPNPLAGKKLVIWCFSVREFTENTDGWKKIPITRPQ